MGFQGDGEPTSKSGGEFSVVPSNPLPTDRQQFILQAQTELGIQNPLLGLPHSTPLSPERKAILLHEIAQTSELLTSSGVQFFLGGGAGLALAGEEDLHRDQYDLDFKARGQDAPSLIRFLNREGFRVLDPETRKWLFRGNVQPRKIVAFKTNPQTNTGPRHFDVYFMEKREDETIKEYRDLPIPEKVYTTGAHYMEIEGVTVPSAPLQVTLLYKFFSIAASKEPRIEDTSDFARYFPMLSEQQFEEFQTLYTSVRDTFLAGLQGERNGTSEG